MVRKKSVGSFIGNAVNCLLIGALCLVTIYPFWNSVIFSISSRASLTISGVRLWPSEVSLDAWRVVLKSQFMWGAFGRSVMRTIAGTVLSLAFTAVMAYPLSKRRFPHRKTFMMMIIFTMLFSGGLIPTYMLIKNLKIINTLWALTLPVLVSPFNLIIIRNFFEGIPESIEESATIDGANDIYIFVRITLPLSMPILATITLWLMVGNWNSWFDAVMYINDRGKFLLQQVLQEMVAQNQADESILTTTGMTIPPMSESMQAATTLFVTLPILIIYPFIQKYFTQGIMVGAIKG